MLVGRDDECARIGALLADARQQRSGALVLRGEPGIGKSALCAWTMSQATGLRVLSVTGVEPEADLAFGGLASLCDPELHRVATLPAPQARALDAALARGEPGPVDRLSVGSAVLSLLAAAAADAPVLVVIDDAQWLDTSSAHALRFAARRLRVEGVAMLIATRPGSPFDGDGSGLPQLPVRPLDPESSRILLAAEHARLAPPVAELLVARSAGNPLALVEIPTVLTAAQRAGDQRIDDPLPIGEALAGALSHRVAKLPLATRKALLIAAATGAGSIQPVLAALARQEQGSDVLEAAERAHVLLIDGDRFEWRHPLLRSAIYHDADGPERRAAHAVLARVTEGELQAWHLGHAAVGEDEAAATALEGAGMSARRRGAPAEAATALEFAARLSAPGHDRIRRLTEAARDAHVAGRPAAAERLLEAALGEEPDALERAAIHHIRGGVLVLQGRADAAFGLLVEEAARIRVLAPAGAAAMLAEACLDAILSADVERAGAVARDACAMAADADQRTQAFASTMLVSALVLGGRRAEASELLDRLLPALRAADPLTEAGQLVSVAAQCCFWLERHDVASELLATLTSAARGGNAPAALLMPLTCSAELDFRAGRWTVAAARFQEAADLGTEIAQTVYAAYPLQCLARLTAVTGEEHRCHEYIARASELVAQHNNELGRLYVHAAAGLLELGLGHVDAAIDRLEPAAALVTRRGIAEPNIAQWHPDLIEAYTRAGKPDAARALLADFERQAEATGGLWTRGAAARCRALLAADVDPEPIFAESLALLESLGAPFEVARTHLCRGERLRRAGLRADARYALRAAFDAFDALGAVPWTARADSELRASGATRRRHNDRQVAEQLTAHELQVARIVAEGASNREAAAALFLSTKTIEYHLASVYRKLGIRRRAELVATMVARGWLDASAAARR